MPDIDNKQDDVKEQAPEHFRVAVIKEGKVVNTIVAPAGFELPDAVIVPLCKLCPQGIHTVESLVTTERGEPGKGWEYKGGTFSRLPAPPEELRKAASALSKKMLFKGLDVGDGVVLATDPQTIASLPSTMLHIELSSPETVEMRLISGGVVSRASATAKDDVKAILNYNQELLGIERQVVALIDDGTIKHDYEVRDKFNELIDSVRRTIKGDDHAVEG